MKTTFLFAASVGTWFAFVWSAMAIAEPAPGELDRCNVVWTTPGKDAGDSMPLGNGEVGINLWVEENGDLYFYISRSDSLSEVSRLLKVGEVRISLSPNPFAAGSPFRQELHLREGRCEITAGEGERKVALTVFVDAARPVVHVIGQSASPVSVKATIESWRTERHVLQPGEELSSAWTMRDAPFEVAESPDVFCKDIGDAVAWYHRNETSVFPLTLKLQGLESAAPKTTDPLLHRTFGGWMAATEFRPVDGRSLATPAPIESFAVRVAVPCVQTPRVKAWLDFAKATADHSASAQAAFDRTEAWWQAFWGRSWVLAGDDKTLSDITRGYTLQRYVQACGGRGFYPIKFNGGIFTVEPKRAGKPFDADWRAWGDCYWFQNSRHIYAPMLAAGDFDMMDSLFRLYDMVRPLCEARAKIYHGVEGCYFPETMNVWGAYSNGDYGWERGSHPARDVFNGMIATIWSQGLELSALMLDRWDYTGDEAFLNERALPMAESVLTYFDTRFRKDANGRIVVSPTQVVETYQKDVVNDMPCVAGLNNLCGRLCALPKRMTTEKQRAFFERMRVACPTIPVEVAEYDGNKVRKLSPAEKYSREACNCENPELYAIWPFRLYGLGKPGFSEAKAACDHRVNHLDVGWGYDGNCAALLGMADEAARILKVKCANSNPGYRWPATWGPNFDWVPDQNHGGNLLETTQLMLLQSDGDVIRLLPAWPKGWDVRFKLHSTHGTTVECDYRGGHIERLRVEPESRRKDVVCTLAPLPVGSDSK